MFERARWIRWFAASVCVAPALFLGGCAAASGGFPHRSENEQADLQALEALYKSADRIGAHYKLPADQRRDDRDDLVNGRLALIDANYKVFVRDFVIEKQRGDTATDIVVIGLNSAGALIVPSSTTRILAGISAAITGSKASFDKNFYYEQTAKALYTAMNAQRKEVRARILDGLTRDISVYPLSQALADLDDYYAAGTFLGGLQSIQRDASTKDAKAQELLDSIRGFVKEPTPKPVQDQIAAIAGAIQNKLTGLSSTQLQSLIQGIDPNAPNTAWASADAAKAWLNKRKADNGRDALKVAAMYAEFEKLKLVGQ